MTIKPVLVPDQDAATLRKLMDRFAEVTTGPTRQQLTESRAAVAEAREKLAEGSAGWMLRQDPALAKKVRDNTQGYKDLKKMAGKPVPKKDEKGVAEGRVDQMAPSGADYSKHSTDELKALLRPGVMGRNELRFKTLIRQELRKREQQGVSEGRAGVDDVDTVGFSVNSEAAYTAVMRRFGDSIDLDETSGIMSAPARIWPQIEMTAFDADPESGAVRVEDDVMEVKHFKTSYGYAGGSKPSGGQYRHPEHAKADSAAKKTVQAQQKNKQLAVDEAAMSRAAKGNEKYGKTGMAALAQAGRAGASKATLDDLRDRYNKYNESVAGPEKCWPGHRKVGTKPGTGKNAGKPVNKCEKISETGMAEVKSEKSAMDTPAVQRAIADMKQRHEKEPFDLEKARALGQKLAARNRDPQRK